jgi:hypothetical protein
MKTAQGLMSAKHVTDVVGMFRDLLTGDNISDKIDANLRSSDLGIQMEGVIGSVLQNKFRSEVVDVNQNVMSSTGRQLTEADIVLTFAIVEVKTGTHPVDLSQLRELQALGRPVVVYAPQATKVQTATLEAAGAKVVKDTTSLLRTLQQLRKKEE